jgi:hypothetical protein
VSSVPGSTVLLIVVASSVSGAQVEYRNLDGGRPVRVEDAAPTERHGLDLDLTTLRFDRLSQDRTRAQLEPRLAYGILPNTEVSFRLPLFIREKGQEPRSGVSGVGAGVMRQLRIESLRLPALSLAADAFIPVGPVAAQPAFSGKALLTKTSSLGRLHLNAAFGNFSVRIPPPPPPSPACGIPGAPPCDAPLPFLPPIDGPCTLSPAEGAFRIAMLCGASQSFSREVASRGTVVSHNHWLAGLAVDKTLPLRSLLIVGDLFAERFEGLNRPVDWTAELGARDQLAPWLVVDAALGRHYSGSALSSFVTFGTTVSHAVNFFGL